MQTCSSNGRWGAVVPCTSPCVSGVCTASPPSCLGLAANCGALSTESCCTSLLVPGGTFNRSNDAGYPATLSDFRLDKYEVSVGRFRNFIDVVVGGWRPAAGSGKHTHLNGGSGLSATDGGNEPGWNGAWNSHLYSDRFMWDDMLSFSCGSGQNGGTYSTWTPTVGDNEKRPINCVSWYQAYAFCIWDGGVLPSEAEWNYAAAGGAEQRIYPWGAAEPGADAKLAVYGCYYGGTGTCTGVINIAPVGSIVAGSGRWGHADLAGNVWEWNLDYYSGSLYPTSACNDCASFTGVSNRVFRGGHFGNAANGGLRTADRGWGGPLPTNPYDYLGFRCARAPQAL
jgi:formylglycine-generating enzyme required for sulfatase activity